MNVLILTPDAVGSTLLQRMITIYMQFHQYDKPVINLHELTNGLVKYYSPEFNRELLGKPRNGGWGYHQTLKEVVDMLSEVDHYKTSRLAQYHIRNRQDSLDQQLPFYRYLDDNFFVIAARRKNLFEHALSWCINTITKKLNVYSAQEKISSFYDLYRSQIEIDTQSLVNHLHNYKSYLGWSNNHFSVASYFYYEEHLANLEKYILNLPIFSAQANKITWKQTYGLEFEDWNRCHYYASDLGAIAMNNQGLLQLENSISQTPTDPDEFLAPVAVGNMTNHLPSDHKTFMRQHVTNYVQAKESVSRMVELGILVTPVPIKKQTLAEKMFMVKNIDQCIDAYNRWVDANPGTGAEHMNRSDLSQRAEQEQHQWSSSQALLSTATDPVLALPPSQQ